MLVFPFRSRQKRSLLLFHRRHVRTTLQNYDNAFAIPRRYDPITSCSWPSSPTTTELSMNAVASLPVGRAVALAPRPSMSMVQFLLVFTAGGLFFSTAVAAVAACYAIGMDNVKRLRGIIRIVIKRVWETLLVGLGATKVALRPDSTGSWKWRDAWDMLKQQLGETRRAAAEGVEAIRLEANMYAAAVGAPGLIPLQYVIDRLMPLSLGAALEESFEDALADVKNKNVKKLTLADFSAGKKSPQLVAARVYDLGTEAMAFDCDVKWDSELQARINVYSVGGLARLPVSVRNINFEGTVRIILAPLVKTQPGFGAALVSFPKVPRIGLDIRVAGGEVTKVPWLRSELMTVIQKSITDELLWPRRLVIPSMVPGSGLLKPKPILSKRELDSLVTTDPLLQVEKALAEKPVLRETMKSDKPDVKSVRKLLNVFVNDENGADKTIGSDASYLNDKLDIVSDGSGDLELEKTVNNDGAIQPNKTHQQPISSVQSGLLWRIIQSSLQKSLQN